jgi:hypothetical protein
VINRTHHTTTLLVYGDEVESVLTAVSAGRLVQQLGLPVSVVLLRPCRPAVLAAWPYPADLWLGGLSTLGGLSYMDITPGCFSPLFAEFLDRAKVVRVALNPTMADEALRHMLQEAGVSLMSVKPHHAQYLPTVQVDSHQGHITSVTLPTGQVLAIDALIDASPDADLARQAGLGFTTGLGQLLCHGDKQAGPPNAFIGVSPVFRLVGVDRHALMAFEATCRQHPELPQWLAEACPSRSTQERAQLLTRPCYSPDAMDYIDILNPVLGVFYHMWKQGYEGTAESYNTAPVWIDGGNVSRLADGSLGFNGMVTRMEDLDTLLAYSHGALPIPANLLHEMHRFEQFLQQAGGLSGASVVPPLQLYVRQTLSLHAHATMTATSMLQGGVHPDQAIGSFSYWLDLRGVTLGDYFSQAHLPKPMANIGLGVALPPHATPNNVAFVGRSAGYSALAQGAGRIVQHNSLLGEGVGIATVLALSQACAIADVPLPTVKAVLDERYQRQFGHALVPQGQSVGVAEGQQDKAQAVLQADFGVLGRS